MYSHIFPMTYLQANLADQLDLSEIAKISDDLQRDFKDPQLIHNKAGNKMSFDKLLLTSRYQHSRLTSVITQYLNQYKHDILGVRDNNLALTESWVNWGLPGTGHHVHNHFNSILSGTFYLQVPQQQGGELVIQDNRPKGSLQHRADNNYCNVTEIFVQVAKYDLVIFPSYIYHGVTENLSDTTRVSLAFNSFYSSAMSSDPVGRSCTGLDLTLNQPQGSVKQPRSGAASAKKCVTK